MNEEGTEAAAATATAVAVRTGARTAPPKRPPIVFRADHPFMFLIRDNRSGSILFIGRVTNPNTSAVVQENPSPENMQPGATLQADETYSERVAKYKEEQQILLQSAENIVFSQVRGTALLIRSYPFLSGSLNGIYAARIEESRGTNAGVNLLFVYKQRTLLPDKTYNCGHDGCALDVYVDDGTGYKQAVGVHWAPPCTFHAPMGR